MDWSERWGVALAAFGDAGNSAWDLIHTPWSDDPDAKGKALGLLLRIPVGIGTGVFDMPASVVQGGFQAYNAVTQPVNDWAHHIGATLPIAANLAYASPTWKAQEGNANTIGAATMIDPETWSKAWDLAEKTSISQALAFNGHTLLDGLLTGGINIGGNSTDILNKVEADKLKESTLFNVVSGLGDAAVSWYTDPIAGSLKVAGAAKKVSNVFGAGLGPNDPWLEKVLAGNSRVSPLIRRPLKDGDPDTLANSDAVNEMLHWAQGKPAWMVKRHPIIKAMSQSDDGAGIISTLIGRDGVGDVETARKVIAVGYGSKTAREELFAKNNDLSVQLSNIENFQNPTFLKALAARDPSQVYTSAYLQQYAKYEKDVASGKIRNEPPKRYLKPMKQLQGEELVKTALQKAITSAIGEHEKASGIMGSMINQVPKVGQSRAAERIIAYDTHSFSSWNEAVFPKPFAPALKVISWPGFKLAHGFTDKRPPSWIDPNRKDASSALWAYMKTSGAFDDATIQAHSNSYMEALDISSRRTAIVKIEHDAIVRLALKQGIDMDTAIGIAKEGVGRKNTIIEKYRKAQDEGNVYGVTKGAGPELTDEDGNILRIPAFETQEVNSVPLADLDAYRRVFSKHTDLIKALGWAGKSNRSGWQVSSELFDAFSSVWSSVNLLRPGYTIRNITDDTLRSLASLGALNLVGQISAGVNNGIGNLPAHIKNTVIRAKNLANVAGEKQIGYLEGATRQQIADRVRGRVDQMGRDLHSLKTQTTDGIILDGHNYDGPYNRLGGSMQRVVGSDFTSISGTTGALLARLRNDFQAEGLVKPEDPGYLSSWTHQIQNTIGQSEIAKRFLEGKNAAEVKDWLRNTAYGRASMRKLGKHGEDVDALVGRAQAVVDQYVPLMRDLPDPFILRKMALDGQVDEKVLEKFFPDPDLRPHVHGPTIAINLSVGPVSDTFHDIIDKGFKFFGNMPTDKLVRHPTFRAMYVGNVRRLHDNFMRQVKGDVTQLTDVDFARIEHASREMSLKQLNGLLFDGSLKSNIAHKLRFMMGFFSAWEDSVTKWAKIAYDKPQTLVNGMKMWNAPNQMNLGSTEDPITGQRVPRWNVVKYNEETGHLDDIGKEWDPWSINDPNVMIQARLPEFIRKFVPFSTNDDGSTTLSKSSLNLSLQGDAWWLPGAGPLTNIVVSKYAAQYPTTLKQVYDWAIPFGGESNVAYGLLPAWSRRLWQSGESVTDGTRAQTMINIAQTQEMKIKLGKRKPPRSEAEFMKEIEDRTDQFFKLRAFTSFFSPVAIQYNSPFKPYIDFYRQLKTQESNIDVQKEMALREKDPGHWVPVTADEQFLEKYGEDFYGFVTSISKNNLGLPASAEAWDKSKKVQGYLNANEPEKAALLIGKIADTKFDQYVYDAQFNQGIGGPLSAKMGRQHQSPDDAIKANEVRLGWIKFTRMMDRIDGMQFDQGMDSDYVDALRSSTAEMYAQKYPEWAKEYYKFDPEALPSRIKQFQSFLKENQKEAVSRPDLRALSTYMLYRESFLNQLNSRYQAGGFKTLKAKENKDLAQEWKNTQVGLAESDTVFGRVFWRYLSNDRLQVSALDN